MISILIFLLTFGMGIFGIILTVDFLDYLRKYEPRKWEEVTYERPFGISRKDFFVHPLKPHRFVTFIFSTEEWSDENIPAYKRKLKITLISFSIFLVISIYVS